MIDKINSKIIKLALEKKIITPWELDKIKRLVLADFKLKLPTNSSLLKTYRELIKNKTLKSNQILESLFRKREIRTLSGVAVIAVMTKPYPCPGKCAYCPTEKGLPKSYLSGEPAVMRAVFSQFDPFRQVRIRLKTLEDNGHPTDKIELIVMGGTWSYLPQKYQNWFIKRCFDGLNTKSSQSLKIAQKRNEKAKHRSVGLTLETRPDYINFKEIKRLRQLGCTRVELGVQNLDDYILQKNSRGHKREEIIKATRLLKNAGFKVMYHLMPNLPGATLKKDLQMFKELFSNPDFQPDMLKIYPCVVTKRSAIYRWWKEGKYKPYSQKQLINLLVKIKTSLPFYVRISRLIRDIPRENIEAGNKISNLREIIHAEMKQKKLKCLCIRCREAKKEKINPKNTKLFIKKYQAAGGEEYFLSYESKNRQILYAFLRLRLPNLSSQLSQENVQLFKYFLELKNAALIREVHTYGQLIPLKKISFKAVQHLGFGKSLINQAEKIASRNGFKKIAAISGIGVREYYRKLGFRLEGTYMVKSL